MTLPRPLLTGQLPTAWIYSEHLTHLNDYRNFETVVKGIKKAGKHFQGCICYSMTEPRMGGDVYNLDYYVTKAKELEAMGADSICVKDMAGLMAPYDAFPLFKALKAGGQAAAAPAQSLHLRHGAHDPPQGNRGRSRYS